MIGGGKISVIHDPPVRSAAFRELRLEKTSSVVVLKIDGEDIQGNMAKVAAQLVRKGYAVRDYTLTLRTLRKGRLLTHDPMEAEALAKASGLFPEEAGIAGRIEVAGVDPPRILLALHWIEMRSQRVLWTVKATFTGRVFARADSYESVIREMVEKALSPLSRAEP